MDLEKGKSFLKVGFTEGIKARQAIERNIEIIGKAVNRVLNMHPELKITNARKIVDTRNRIFHGYDTVYEDVFGL